MPTGTVKVIKNGVCFILPDDSDGTLIAGPVADNALAPEQRVSYTVSPNPNKLIDQPTATSIKLVQ